MYPGWGRHEPLLTAFDSHHAAVIRMDGVLARLRLEPRDVELHDRSLVAADEVLATRIKLYAELIELGWQPPATIVEDLEYDDVVRTMQGR